MAEHLLGIGHLRKAEIGNNYLMGNFGAHTRQRRKVMYHFAGTWVIVQASLWVLIKNTVHIQDNLTELSNLK